MEPLEATLQRPHPNGWEPVDHAEHERLIADSRQDRDEQTQPRWSLINHLGYLGRIISYARDCVDEEELERVPGILNRVRREWPSEQQCRQHGKEDSYFGTQRYFLEVVRDFAFRTGDTAGFAEAGEYCLRAEKQELDRKVRSGDAYPSDYKRLAWDWGDFLDRLIVLGGDPAQVARMHAEWMEMRRLCGFASGDFDRRRFRYLQESY
jgi:hypothetical protein